MIHRSMPPIPTNPAAIKAEILWLQTHPLWSHHDPDGAHWGDLADCMDMMFVYVDPVTECIEDDATRNTEFRVWVEAGGWYDQSQDKNVPTPDGGVAPVQQMDRMPRCASELRGSHRGRGFA